jgi:hypothetical protein
MCISRASSDGPSFAREMREKHPRCRRSPIIHAAQETGTQEQRARGAPPAVVNKADQRREMAAKSRGGAPPSAVVGHPERAVPTLARALAAQLQVQARRAASEGVARARPQAARLNETRALRSLDAGGYASRAGDSHLHLRVGAAASAGVGPLRALGGCEHLRRRGAPSCIGPRALDAPTPSGPNGVREKEPSQLNALPHSSSGLFTTSRNGMHPGQPSVSPLSPGRR